MSNRDPFIFESDQTQFAAEEPMYEPMTSYPQAPKLPEKPSVPFMKRKWAVPVIVVGSTMAVLLLLLIINVIVQRNRTPQVPITSPVLSPTDSGQVTPLVDKVTALETELKAADPNQPTFVFPSVDLSLTLDQPTQ